MRSLRLDIAFENPKLAVALPSGLFFGKLQRLTLRLGDVESVRFTAELLECIESPVLRDIEIESAAISGALVSALSSMIPLAAERLKKLTVWWVPSFSGKMAHLDEQAAVCWLKLLEAMPAIEQLGFGVAPEVRGAGVDRGLATLQPPLVTLPGTNPLLANMVLMTNLRELTFDFIADDVLLCLHDIPDRSLMLQRANFSGLRKHIEDPDAAMMMLLQKLGDGLEELSLMIEVDAYMRPYFSGSLRTRVGALDQIWQSRIALRRLELNWTAFDDEGLRSMATNCPELHTLILDRSEYWTDAVALIMCDSLPELRNFRMRSSEMLTDQALYTFAEAAHRFATLEVEPSYSMSSYALNHLKSKMTPNDPLFDPLSASTIRLIQNATDAVGYGAMAAQPNLMMLGELASSPFGMLVLLKSEDEQIKDPAAPVLRRRAFDIGNHALH